MQDSLRHQQSVANGLYSLLTSCLHEYIMLNFADVHTFKGILQVEPQLSEPLYPNAQLS